MVVGGSQQETLDPGFVLFGTHQQGVPVILRELVLLSGFDLMSLFKYGSMGRTLQGSVQLAFSHTSVSHDPQST
ncbi:unnamed protein product [Schistosoma margrebowiei]|uniref:Uncharacterized protein n=1 Tax=Schistosoma margrebowiei TaxID=48269 RepID=A0A183M246_9TREM|nr:unnamed protein product [Schistosoma margrebowiei]